MNRFQEKIQKLKLAEGKLEDDKKQLRISLDDAENRLTKAELMRRGLEGDLQRMKLALNDRETENQVLVGRAENLMHQIHDLESKSHSPETTIERLNMALAKSEEEESVRKNQVGCCYVNE
jgi:chromosome segregation ATPase